MFVGAWCGAFGFVVARSVEGSVYFRRMRLLSPSPLCISCLLVLSPSVQVSIRSGVCRGVCDWQDGRTCDDVERQAVPIYNGRGRGRKLTQEGSVVISSLSALCR